MITDASTARQANGDAHGLQIEQKIAIAANGSVAPGERAIAFGPFRLLPTRRLLLEGHQRVHLGSRALEILIALIERPGVLVSKSELMARVWPDTFVEEGNLKVQVAGLRRALGDSRDSNRYLATVPGRGYRFVAPVTRTDGAASRIPPEAAHPLPTRMTAMIDRGESVDAVIAQLPQQRLVTIVGPGGIGKTTVAVAVASSLSDRYADGVRFIDLAAVADPRLVPRACAAGLGLEPAGECATETLLTALADRRMLLVLDNCEHVIEAAAASAVELLNRAPGVQILATSREPLRAEGEHVHRLPSLASPPAAAWLTAAQAQAFPAVQLFVERAAATSSLFRFGDEDAPLVADICRRLDGIPLAIELAAARIDAFGVRGLAAQLRDPLQLLSGGRRPAPERHRTLRATLDWGHALLSAAERAVLHRLAVFAGSFTLEAASAIAASAEIAAADVVGHVANLVAKSFVAADLAGSAPRYRLLGITRAYALEKLVDSGELEHMARRHAEHAPHRGERAEAARSVQPMPGRLAACGRRADDAETQDWERYPTDAPRPAPPTSSRPMSLHP